MFTENRRVYFSGKYAHADGTLISLFSSWQIMLSRWLASWVAMISSTSELQILFFVERSFWRDLLLFVFEVYHNFRYSLAVWLLRKMLCHSQVSCVIYCPLFNCLIDNELTTKSSITLLVQSTTEHALKLPNRDLKLINRAINFPTSLIKRQTVSAILAPVGDPYWSPR